MPLTVSHPALVLPLRRAGLPMAALVLGSMVPDTPLFLTGMRGYGLTHSLLGLVTVDVAATLVLLTAWTYVARDALVDLSPSAVRSRLAPRARLGRRDWLLAPVAAAVGAASHVLWDAFTHADRWGATHIAWLREEHAGLAGYSWAQYVSGVVGLAIVLGAATSHVWRQPRAFARPPAALSPVWLPVSALVSLAVGAVAGIARTSDGLHAMAFDGVVAALATCSVSVTLVCLAWHGAVRSPARA